MQADRQPPRQPGSPLRAECTQPAEQPHDRDDRRDDSSERELRCHHRDADQDERPSATTRPGSADRVDSSISVTGGGDGCFAAAGSSSAGNTGDGSVTSASPIAAAGRVSSTTGDRVGAGAGGAEGVASRSLAQPGNPSDGMTVKLLLQFGQVALAPIFDWGARTPPARQ